jgi:LysM repeat protein
MIDPAMGARKPGRYLAVIALLAVIVATVLVVRAGLGHAHHQHRTPSVRLPSTHHVAPRKRFYVIRPGDSLSEISVRTGVPVTRLEALNPAIDPNALQAGHHLRLRP